MLRYAFLSLHLLSILVLVGCAAQTNLEPLGKDVSRTTASFGGPVIEAFDTRIPVPYLSVGFERGLGTRVNGGATLHLLPLAYGVAGLDLAVAEFPLLQRGARPTVGIEARLMNFASLRKDVESRFRIYPILTPSFAWKQRTTICYTGCNVVLPLTEPEYDPQSVKVIFSPFAGARWKIGTRVWLLTELKWQGANARSDQLAVKYLPLGRHGAVTPFVALQWGAK